MGVLTSACDIAAPASTKRPLVVLSTSPAEGDTAVPINGPFIVNFDRRVLPSSVSRATIRVQSGTTFVMLSVRYDLLEQRAVAVPFDAPLSPDVDYRFVVDGVLDLDNQTLNEPVTVHFHTGSTLGAGAPIRATAPWSDVAPIFAESCASAGCHSESFAAAGLDLSSAAGVAYTAVGAVSTTLPSGTIGSEGAAGGPFFSGMRVVDVLGGVGRPETSYLLYTVVGDAHIYGDPMPPAAPLSQAEIQRLVAWVNGGAPTE